MFTDNKYTKWYNLIISNARSVLRSKKTGYYERHHVVPFSLGGDNSRENLVLLTPKEHLICHMLLTKMTLGKDRIKMVYALNNMRRSSDNQKRVLTPGQYSFIRRMHSEICKNRRHSEETRNKMRGKKTWQTGLTKHTDERIMAMAKSMIGHKRNLGTVWDDDKKARHSEKTSGEGNGFYGKKHSEETRKKLSIMSRGRSHTEETKKRLSEIRTRNPSPGARGKIWINDGSINKMINREDSIPEGFTRGRISLG